MIVTKFQRPNNFIANRLGFGSTWRTLISQNMVAISYGSVFPIFFRVLIHSLFKLGEIWKKHPFLHFLYTRQSSGMMPDIQLSQISKFLRLVRMRRDLYNKTRHTFNIRKYLHYLLMSDLFFYRNGRSVIILMYAHIPEPIKRFKIYKVEEHRRLSILKNLKIYYRPKQYLPSGTLFRGTSLPLLGYLILNKF